MRYEIVTSEGVVTFNTKSPCPAFAVRGYDCTELNYRPNQRAELQGQPRFSNLNGPMWGGIRDGVITIRYEGGGA